VHVVDDGGGEVAGEDEVGVEGVGDPLGLDGAGRRREGLREDLPAEDPPRADVPVLPPEDVFLDPFEVEEGEEGGEGGGHGRGGQVSPEANAAAAYSDARPLRPPPRQARSGCAGSAWRERRAARL